ncbi:MAG TPA: DUF4870 domain-containing protein [Patescibacteria group bacterium]|nr:DUF4870 domain-containing protein [Patescibacteria group bacterium]
METKDLGKTSTGMQANVAGLVAYAAGWVSGLIMFLIEKDNKFVRFHALQSIIVFGALSVLGFALSLFFQIFIMIHLYFMFQFFVLITKLLWLVAVILWIILMVKAYQGDTFKLPVAGDIAEKNIGK